MDPNLEASTQPISIKIKTWYTEARLVAGILFVSPTLYLNFYW